MLGETEHLDIRARAKHLFFGRSENDGGDLRMLETEPLHRIIEFDIDRQIIRIQLELVTRADTAVLVHIHRQSGDLAVEAELPVAVAVGTSPKLDHGSAPPFA